MPTAREIQRRRSLSQALSQQANSPAATARAGRNPLFGIADALRQFGAGRGEFLANQQEQENAASRQSALANALRGGGVDLSALSQSQDPRLQQLALSTQLQQRAAAPGLELQQQSFGLKQKQFEAQQAAQQQKQAALEQIGGLVGQEGTTAQQLAPLLAQTGDVKGAIALTPGLSPEADAKKFDKAGKLRKDFLSESKDFVKVNQAFERIKASASGGGPEDLSLIFNFMKMLDPGSVVRESEFANAQFSAGVPDVILAAREKIFTGGRLSDNSRAKFVAQAEKLFVAANKGQTQLEKQFIGIAERAKLNPQNVVIDFRVPQEGSQVEQLTPEEEAEAQALEAELGISR